MSILVTFMHCYVCRCVGSGKRVLYRAGEEGLTVGLVGDVEECTNRRDDDVPTQERGKRRITWASGADVTPRRWRSEGTRPEHDRCQDKERR